MNTQVKTILNNEEMLKKMLSEIDRVCKDFPHIKEEYEQSLCILRRELGDEKIEQLLDAINRRCEADLIFCGSLGYQANLQNFRDPVARTFMDVDCEEYLRVHVLEGMPQREQAGPGGKFCVSVFRQNQEYHIINVHDWGLFPLATAFPGGWDGMRAGTA